MRYLRVPMRCLRLSLWHLAPALTLPLTLTLALAVAVALTPTLTLTLTLRKCNTLGDTNAVPPGSNAVLACFALALAVGVVVSGVEWR